MKMKSILLVVLALCLTVCMCACGGSENGDTTTTTNGGNAATTTTTTTTAAPTTTTTTVADGKVTYTVTVTDEAGNPISGAFVQLCLEACVPCMTNAQGVASYPNMNEADYKVSFINIPEGYTVETNEFHFEAGSTEMTIVLKAA
jgi:hypothetical protein